LNQIIIQNAILGGLSDSKYIGIANSLHKIVGFDLHSEPGIMKVHQKLKKDSGPTVTEFVKVAIPCSNGETYLFSATSGKVWARTSAGVYRLAYTTVPTSGTAGCSGGFEYDGYIYWATQNYLHRVSITAALVASWTSVDLNWEEFANGDADFHPFALANNVLYIGDGNYIAQVDDGVFSANAMDVVSPFRMSALSRQLTNLIYGTYVNANVRNVVGGRWKTWGDSFDSDDDVPEPGINAYLPSDNYNLVSAGRKGNLYQYDGTFFKWLKRIPGDWSAGNEAVIYPRAAENFGGLLRLGLSRFAGTPTECGIYSFGRYAPEYPSVLSFDFPISTGNTALVEIGCVFFIGETMYCTWKDSTSTPTYGVDVVDAANKQASAYFDTRLIAMDRANAKDYNVEVAYRTIPAGCSIQLWVSKNYGAFVQHTDFEDNALNYKMQASVNVSECVSVQFRVVAVSLVNAAPEIEQAIISFN
jgi:hypothetical protein